VLSIEAELAVVSSVTATLAVGGLMLLCFQNPNPRITEKQKQANTGTVRLTISLRLLFFS
jgi:hypothetical protein